MLKYDPIKETIKLWWEYRDKDINYKNWWNMKDTVEGGILNKDFIKKHLQRETELEDKVFELENKIKALREASKGTINDIGARLLTKIAMRMQIQMPEMSLDKYYSRAGTVNLSVDDVLIDDQEYQYLRELATPVLTNVINDAISSKISADIDISSKISTDISSTQLMNNYADDLRADAGPSMYGLGGPIYYKNFDAII